MRLFIITMLLLIISFQIVEVRELKHENEVIKSSVLIQEIRIAETLSKLKMPYAFDSSIESRHDYYIHANRMAKENGVPFELLVNLLFHESGFCMSAYNVNINGSYDTGISQINSNYREHFEKEYELDLENAYNQIEFTARHLAYLFSVFGEWSSAVASYNAGEERVKTGDIPISTQGYTNYILNGLKNTP